jgi:hypothetical protein
MPRQADVVPKWTAREDEVRAPPEPLGCAWIGHGLECAGFCGVCPEIELVTKPLILMFLDAMRFHSPA